MTWGSDYADWSLQNTSQNKVTKELFYKVVKKIIIIYDISLMIIRWVTNQELYW